MSNISKAEPSLSSQHAQNQQINVFNTELLLASIHQTDDLIRNLHQKVDEIKKLKRNSDALNASAKNIRELYTCEKLKLDKVQQENEQLKNDYMELKKSFQLIEHEKINNENLHKQITAELEENILEIKNQNEMKKLDLYDTIVSQGYILQSKNLANAILKRKCTIARDFLQANNRKFEWFDKSPSKSSKVKNSPTKMSCASTMTDLNLFEIPKRVQTHDKGTMYIQSKTTRSTCTSAFIKKTDASTNTDSDDDYDLKMLIDSIFDDLKPKALQLSPIRDFDQNVEFNDLQLKTIATQTAVKQLCTQGTITNMQNIRKRLTIETTMSDNDVVKKETLPPTFEFMSNWLTSKKFQSDEYNFVNQRFLQLWTTLGELLFPMATQPNLQISDQKLSDRLRQMQLMLGTNLNMDYCQKEAVTRNDGNKLDDRASINLNDDINEASRDSYESYHSDKFIVSEARNFSTLTENITNPPSPQIKLVENQQSCDSITMNPPPFEMLKPKEPPIVEAKKSIKRKSVQRSVENHSFKKQKANPKVCTQNGHVPRNVCDTFNVQSHFQDTTREADDVVSAFEDVFKILEDFRLPDIISPIQELSSNRTTTEQVFDCDSQITGDSPDSNVNNNVANEMKKEVEIENHESVEEEQIEENEHDIESPASPSPPSELEEEISNKLPAIIPLTSLTKCSINQNHTETTLSNASEPLIKHLISNYSNEKRDIFINSNKIELTKSESIIVFDIRKCIENHCLAITDWTSDAATMCVTKMLNISKRPKYLTRALLEVIEDSREPIHLEYTPPAPAMSRSLQKCFILLKRLDSTLQIIEYFRYQLEYALFSLKQNRCAAALTQLTHFYMTILDVSGSSNSNILLFIYKSLYFYTHKATPLIYATLMAHPMTLLHVNNIENTRDPLIYAITSALMNIPYHVSVDQNDDLKKKDMFNVLKRRYGYFAGKSFPAEMIVELCINCIRSGQLENVQYALILISKRKGFEWGQQFIIKQQLEPLLYKYITNDIINNSKNDKRIEIILCSIASIIRSCSDEINVDYYLDIFDRCLNATNRSSIQQPAIVAICQMSRFGIEKCFRKLESWKPSYDVHPKVMAILWTFVHKENNTFWFGKTKKPFI